MSALVEKAARYEEFLKSDPENTTLLVTLADIYHQSGQFGQALDRLRRVNQLEPENSVAKARMAASRGDCWSTVSGTFPLPECGCRLQP